MTVFTMCVDPERGKYIALAVGKGGWLTAISHTSEAEAVGLLVAENGEITIEAVNSVEISTKKGRPRGSKNKTAGEQPALPLEGGR